MIGKNLLDKVADLTSNRKEYIIENDTLKNDLKVTETEIKSLNSNVQNLKQISWNRDEVICSMQKELKGLKSSMGLFVVSKSLSNEPSESIMHSNTNNVMEDDQMVFFQNKLRYIKLMATEKQNELETREDKLARLKTLNETFKSRILSIENRSKKWTKEVETKMKRMQREVEKLKECNEMLLDKNEVLRKSQASNGHIKDLERIIEQYYENNDQLRDLLDESQGKLYNLEKICDEISMGKTDLEDELSTIKRQLNKYTYFNCSNVIKSVELKDAIEKSIQLIKHTFLDE